MIFLALAGIFITCGCNGCGSGGASYQAIVFSDVHFDPFYDTSLFQTLNAADHTKWADIFATSTVATPSAWGSDTNYPLLRIALSSIRENGGTSSVAIFAGDMLSHDFDTTFYSLYGSTDYDAMKAFAYKTVAFFASQVRSYLGNIPVMFELGNNDEYEGDYKLEPNSQFLSDTAEILYTDLLNGTADHQSFLNTYEAGGYYSAEPLGNGLEVIGLNTVFFSPHAASDVNDAVQAELNWFDSTLAAAQAAGKKVWLLIHIPPGANIHSTKDKLDAEGHLSEATMMWNDDYQEIFLRILSKYSDIVTLSISGHTHMDEYRLPSGALEGVQSISPIDGNNPAFKLITFSADTFTPIDYTSFSYDLENMSGQFDTYYAFSAAYLLQALLNDALAELFPELENSGYRQAFYRRYYYSGHDSASTITDTNWKVYWCGIGKMVEAEIIDCVNTY
jgi:hypothetical protein